MTEPIPIKTSYQPVQKFTKAHQRYRTKDNSVVPGVTTICGQWGEGQYQLMGWCRKLALDGIDPDLVRDRAGRIGTIAHQMIAGKILNASVPLESFAPDEVESAKHAYNGFIMWNQDYPINYTDVERYVVSEKYRYGGCLDLLGERNGKIILIDIKTGTGIYSSMKVQVAAYKVAYEEETGIKVDESHILNTHRDTGAFAHYKLSDSDIEYGFEAFQYCLGLYNLAKKLK